MTDRLFLAIPITDSLRDRLRELQEISIETLSEYGIQNLRPENLNNSHITVRFLGDVSSVAQHQLIAAMGQTKLTQAAFDFCVNIIGVFDSPQKVRVLWAGVDQLPAFQALRRDTDTMLEGVGFERERKPFAPHLTLLRFRDPQDITDCFQELKQLTDVCSIERYPVQELALYSSKLSPQGATHTKRAYIKLSGAQ